MQWPAHSLWYLLCLRPATANRCDAALLRPCLESLAKSEPKTKTGRSKVPVILMTCGLDHV